ncbi:MAG: hypothetical protein A3C84_00330 [Candidatus Ryanbacteria bacterium RIFCSPHIGHO2_02_FULL_48_12]|uniref:Uncharacterized protein n=1 Tax=Candidatus Ryanbacteria bacterium RIFCSPHIGHO2_01_FULL_48_27 TaxID=1802115 RepID=A0A1G2G680_9BACT|nr:MAG: hypothetical protein A2756_02495 [Candidatus Ryanbacteria bacterium RIFCSPHIGHO2_01_FULL_48_27]OGZ50461.1 MAG: hypothetical protein A3C84_00330 [Candidatus Ryanbacteria bacterium RIFCSPHIGHO2_02_FULL_48_12]
MNSVASIQLAKREIKKLNRLIDQKIIRGESYRSESRRHKELVHRLQGLSQHSWFERTFMSFSLF